MSKMAVALTAIGVALFALTGAAELQAQESGVELWGRTCTRCHNARPINERTDREWTTIVQHMRARANLTRTEARKILQFLQAANAPEVGTVSEAPLRPSGPDDLLRINTEGAAETWTASDVQQIAALITYLGHVTRRAASTP